MPSDKIPSFIKSPPRAAASGRAALAVDERSSTRRAGLLAPSKITSAQRANLLKQKAEIYDWLSRLPDGKRKIPKAEVQRILEFLEAVPIPDPSPAVMWVSDWRKTHGELSTTASFVSSMGTSLDIMPLSTAADNTWWRDRAALKHDTARIADDVWCVITRQGHEPKRRKDA